MKLKLDILSFLFFMLFKMESSCFAACSEVFNNFPTNSIQSYSNIFSVQTSSVRQWIESLTINEIKAFIPEWSHLRLVEEIDSPSKIVKLLIRFANRINLEHGALFAVTHSVEAIAHELDLLSKEVNAEVFFKYQYLNRR